MRALLTTPLNAAIFTTWILGNSLALEAPPRWARVGRALRELAAAVGAAVGAREVDVRDGL